MLKHKVLYVTLFMITVQVLSNKAENENKLEKPCEEWKSVKLDAKPSNNIKNIIEFNGIKYSQKEIFRDGHIIRGCPCIKNICVRKCCPSHQIYSKLNKTTTCVDNADKINVIESIPDNNVSEIIKNGMVIVSHELKPYCQNQKMEVLYDGINTLHSNGTLDANDQRLLTIDDYCFDFFEVFNKSVFFLCRPGGTTNNGAHNFFDFVTDNQTKRLIYAYLMIISLPFLVITCLIHIFVPGFCNLKGKCLSSLTGSISSAFILFPLVLIEGDSDWIEVICKPLGYAVQYSFISSFLWLNVMCVDIWLVFSKRGRCKKYIKYAIYAWGSPITICLITYIADEVIPADSDYKPRIGEQICFFENEKSKQVFYYFPVTIILFLNIFLFSQTAYIIYSHKKKNKFLYSGGNRAVNAEKERLNLYFRLFLVMGIPWINEPLSYYFDDKPPLLWFLLDAINLIQGISIFIIFVCNGRTLRRLNDKFSSSQFFSSSSGTESTSGRS